MASYFGLLGFLGRRSKYPRVEMLYPVLAVAFVT